MSAWRLLFTTLRHHWRSNLAIVLGVIAATAVVTGALVVGDSVRGSLRDLTLARLGRVDWVLTGPRFVREELAAELERQPQFAARFATAAPAIELTCTVEHPTDAAAATSPAAVTEPAATAGAGAGAAAVTQSGAARAGVTRAGRVQLHGLTREGWRLLDPVRPEPGNSEVIINAPLARQLGVGVGAELTLTIEVPSDIPRDTLLGRREGNAATWPVTVREVLPEESGAGRFGLRPDQQLPLNVFVALPALQERLGLDRREPSRRDPTSRPARINTLLVAGAEPRLGAGSEAIALGEELNRLLGSTWGLEDLRLRVVAVRDPQYLSLESDRMILDTETTAAGREAAGRLGGGAVSEVLVYIANSIRPSFAGDKAAGDNPLGDNPLGDKAAARKAAGDKSAGAGANAEPAGAAGGEAGDAARREGGEPEAGSGRLSRYSVVAGLDPRWLQPDTETPFGRFSYVAGGAPAEVVLSPRSAPAAAGAGGAATVTVPNAGAPAGDLLASLPEVVINDWLAEDLRVGVGESVELAWHRVGSHGELPEVTGRFRVVGIVRLEGAGGDRGLVPEVPGITNVKSFDDWEAPFPMQKVTPRDDEYWTKYRATPKAFLTLATARQLFQNRYGDATSLRIALPATKEAADAEATGDATKAGSGGPAGGVDGVGGVVSPGERRLREELRQSLDPLRFGLRFQPVKAEGLRAAAGTTDFGGLFLGFSLFLILAAAILISLLFRLGLDSRGRQVGVLLATGLGTSRVRRWLLLEASLLAVLGGLLGAWAGVAYARLMVHGLKTWWVGAIGTRFLDVHVTPTALLGGVAVGIGVAIVAMLSGLRGLTRVAPRDLLVGRTTASLSSESLASRSRRSLRWGLACWLLAAVLSGAVLLRLIPDREATAGLSIATFVFFFAGMLALAGGLLALGGWIDSDRGLAVGGRGVAGAVRLGFRNAARHRTRSLFSTALIAAATFLIVAIAAGHRNPAVETPDRLSGNGGFELVAETDVPILRDFNTSEGRSQLGLDDPASTEVLRSVREVVPFLVNPGENASCLNIYRTTQPTILGVPERMLDRGGFKFADTPGAEPWRLLAHRDPDGAIPVLGDLNTLQYSLHLGMNGRLSLRSESGQEQVVRVAGMLDGSVFQGVLLMHETHFRELFPARVGAQYLLVDVDRSTAGGAAGPGSAGPGSAGPGSAGPGAAGPGVAGPGAAVVSSAGTAPGRAVSELLESRIAGLDAERVADRLTSFLAVQNTYLSTFQALGGLGLLLGTLGLATVMLRNVLERRSELALLRAVGLSRGRLVWVVLAENALLLGCGLVLGTVSALVAMSPHLVKTGADFPLWQVAWLLLAVGVTGLLAATWAARAAIRTPLVSSLRSE
jgi:ABC-type lipoprotein release transport system permease subunit